MRRERHRISERCLRVDDRRLASSQLIEIDREQRRSLRRYQHPRLRLRDLRHDDHEPTRERRRTRRRIDGDLEPWRLRADSASRNDGRNTAAATRRRDVRMDMTSVGIVWRERAGVNRKLSRTQHTDHTMSTKRRIAAVVAVFLVAQIFAIAIHGFILAADYAPYYGRATSPDRTRAPAGRSSCFRHRISRCRSRS